MARTNLIQPDLVPDGVVAWNLAAARKHRGWTQAEATERLSNYGYQWSIASLSDAERSWRPDARHREFTASDLVAFSLAFELPIPWWFLPPGRAAIGEATIGLVGVTLLERRQVLELLYGSSPEVHERLEELGAVEGLTASQRRQLIGNLDHQRDLLEELVKNLEKARSYLMESHADNPEVPSNG